MGCATDWEFFQKTLILSAPGSLSMAQGPFEQCGGLHTSQGDQRISLQHVQRPGLRFCCWTWLIGEKNRLRKIKSKKTGHKGNILIM